MTQKTYPLTVQKKIHECEGACTLELVCRPEDAPLFKNYKPAQFLSFHLEIEEEKIRRSYSISSSPLSDEHIHTSIKKVPGGKASSYLVDVVQEGDKIQSSRPQGRFFKIPQNLKPRHYLMLAGGSGITPLFSIIKTALLSDEKNQITLVYCNRNENSIIYKKPLEKWQKLHSDRFHIVHILSRPLSSEKKSNILTGRLTEEAFKKILHPFVNIPSLDTEFYLCGPTELMKMTEKILLQNFDKTHIRKESFGQKKPQTAKAPEKALIIGSRENQKPVEAIHARLDGEDIKIAASEGIPILEQLIEAGYSPPFSCMEGSCMTCMGVLKKGQVYQDEPGILSEENISEKEILTCQAKPLSELVEVDYD